MEEIEKGNIKITVYEDDAPESPREWDNLGNMVCFSKKYNLGDNHNFRSLSHFLEEIKPNKNLILPLYLYDHSGITISTSPFNCSWDSGQVGYIYVSYEDIKKEYGKLTKATKEKVKNILIGEVKTYDQFLTGDVYFYTIEKRKKCKCCDNVDYEQIDSCSGFYGLSIDNGMLDHIENKKHKELLKELLEKV